MGSVTDIQDRMTRMASTEPVVLRVFRTVQRLERQVRQIMADNPDNADEALQTLAAQFIAFGAKPEVQTFRPTLAFADFLQATQVPAAEAGERPVITIEPADLWTADAGLLLSGSYAPITLALSKPLQDFLEHWNNLSLTLGQTESVEVPEPPVNNVRQLRPVSSPELGA